MTHDAYDLLSEGKEDAGAGRQPTDLDDLPMDEAVGRTYSALVAVFRARGKEIEADELTASYEAAFEMLQP
jgi:hypothetical protein